MNKNGLILIKTITFNALKNSHLHEETVLMLDFPEIQYKDLVVLSCPSVRFLPSP